MTKAEALYDFIFGSEYDEDTYDSLEDAIEDLVEENSWGLECDGGEYIMFDSYSDAEDAAQQSVKDLIDDIGVEGFTVDLERFVDSSWFEDAEQESHESYAQEIRDESSSDDDMYVNRLHEELCDYGIMEPLDLPEEPNEDDYEDSDNYDTAVEEWEEECGNLRAEAENEADSEMYSLSEKMMSDDSVEWYMDNFGTEDFNDIVKRHNLIDEDELAAYVVDVDGCGHVLSSYDGEEYENEGYYIYRTN
jgi:hypothetical protein